MFSSNLKLLTQETSISCLCRQMGMNRTQFSRYRNGEAFPRPEVLKRICDHFGVDASILLVPLPEMKAHVASLATKHLTRDELAELSVVKLKSEGESEGS
ncbi:MAG: helix-turn-helix transcriptional regulator [Tritonibacter mobilis]|nr:helix-turn-helix transcriptional regulator [Tritonibacter mobilis]